jgi:hypothetical protein
MPTPEREREMLLWVLGGFNGNGSVSSTPDPSGPNLVMLLLLQMLALDFAWN